MSLSLLSLRTPRSSENSPEQTAQLLSSLARAVQKPNHLKRLLGRRPVYLSLEVSLSAGQITFAVVYPPHLHAFIESQVLATYPDVIMTPISDYLRVWSPSNVSLIRQSAPSFFPLRDYADYRQVDPMLPLLGVLSKASSTDTILIQFVLAPAPKSTTAQAARYLIQKFEYAPDGKPIRELVPPGKKIVEDKLSHPLVGVSIRFAASRKDLLPDLHGAISVLNRPDGNSLVPTKLFSWNLLTLQSDIINRIPTRVFNSPLSVLNVMELSSLWHLPGVQTKVNGISWAPDIAPSEAPDNLPVFAKSGDNSTTNFFAQTNFKHTATTFGIHLPDRLRHMYILGKSGTGKSTLLENLAIDDFKKNQGVAFIDPHGDSVEKLLNYIPSHRINDTIYFNPADTKNPISLNVLECPDPEQAELVVSGIMAIFHKLYGKFWGPRMQYILRNALLTLVHIPDSTLPDVVKILSDPSFRKALYPKITNPQLLAFWTTEFDTLEDKVRLEYTYPILNKVGQFVNSPLVQKIISHPKSSIDLAEIMNSQKIFLANLSQGRLGEDNATLLGAMLITKFELAAMSRITTPEPKRPNFFLYVDEFQNFATESFVKMLSEARKFRLGLILANQYIAQLTPEIQKSVFGNVGTLISFIVGSEDARVLASEFAPVFDENSLVNLQKFQIALKLTIDGNLSRPFTAFTLPPPASVNQHKAKVISESQKRYSSKA